MSGIFGQQRDVELLGEQLSSALAEELVALAVGSDEARHVLDHARDLKLQLRRHLGRPARDLLGHGLRRRDDHELRLGQELGERHRDVAGARREVDQEVVELAPLDVLEELLQSLVEHRAPPHDRRVLLDEEPDRDHRDAVMRRERHDLALPVDPRPLGAEPSIRGCE